MGKKLDAIRAAIERKQIGQGVGQVANPKPPQNSSSTAPPKPTTFIAPTAVAAATPPKQQPALAIPYRCGHTVSLKELAGLDCGPCRDQARQARAARKRAKREAAHAARPPEPGRVYRLPDGCAKFLRYVGGVWSGRLRVPGVKASFVAKAGSELECLRALHAAYEQWLAMRREDER